ncbi:MAG: UDP-N-acetylmuramoyl-tripeptide--D-alanyl-D-alanine ligase [Lachnospiraceae bacterium]|nr:UDP-N-acetylmuramoyl-tripeptide--D-alanyl-D-alanine ligase [Lachnospiraceae bacterium]
MKGMTPTAMAYACHGRYHGPGEVAKQEVTAVTTDSRKVTPGSLYVPMKGTKVDGHSFIESAMKAGALLTLTEHAEGMPEGFPYILVDSTADAIQEIAGLYRRNLDIQVVGITGSVGKTSTKEMIAAVLSQKYRVLKTAGNFNNNLGLPLTVFRLTEEDEIAVLEMGISHFGEMTKLAETAEPDTMVITNIGTCHLEFLKDRDGVFRAKTECFDYVKLDGTVILNGDDDKLVQVEEVHGRRPIFYGMSPRCRVSAENVQPLGLKGISCTINIDDESFDVTVPVPGMHQVMNALAAAAVGTLYGLTTDEIKAGIESLESLAGRFHIIENDRFTVIDDCYNANPMSMKASLDVLKDANGRKVAILGDMGELGAEENELHYEVGQHAGELPIDKFIFVGPLSEEIEKGLLEKNPQADSVHFPDVDALLKELASLVVDGDTVLVKASHFMQFERITEALA